MNPSGFQGGAEECSSSESGWTMYIASPSDEYDDGEGDDKVEYEEDEQNTVRVRSKNGVESTENGDSDDSMASDASSGPSYHHERSHGKEKLKYASEKDTRKYTVKKQHKEEESKFSKNTKLVREDSHRSKTSYGKKSHAV